MTASDHLGLQWYHGTSADLSPGDYIEPGHTARHVYTHGEVSGQHVYAAADAGQAGFFGHNVYKVEPTGPMEPDPEDVWSMGFHRSNQPMRITGKL